MAPTKEPNQAQMMEVLSCDEGVLHDLKVAVKREMQELDSDGYALIDQSMSAFDPDGAKRNEMLARVSASSDAMAALFAALEIESTCEIFRAKVAKVMNKIITNITSERRRGVKGGKVRRRAAAANGVAPDDGVLGTMAQEMQEMRQEMAEMREEMKRVLAGLGHSM